MEKQLKETKASLAKRGKKNASWKGDKAGYGAIHAWVRKRKKKPVFCERCKKRKAIDLANISGEYLRDVNDFEDLCRKCHMDSDGRNEGLRQSGKSRKLPEQICKQCGKSFHRDSIGKFCNRNCYDKFRTGKKRPLNINKNI